MENISVVFESTKPQKFVSGDLFWVLTHAGDFVLGDTVQYKSKPYKIDYMIITSKGDIEVSLKDTAFGRIDLKDLKKIQGKYVINPPIGKAKYSISTYNGIDTHPDGSPFWGLVVCKNHQDFQFKLRDLTQAGYKEIL